MAAKNDCIPWGGAKYRNGYGMKNVLIDGRKTTMTAHRYVYQMANGPLHRGQVVRHTCDNPECVNLAHLVPGSQGDNMRDAYDRDRRAPTGFCKPRLSDADVAEIRKSSASGTALAALYGCSKQHISKLRRGERRRER